MSFRNKRGGVGNFIVMYVATVAIVVILLIFVFGSGLVKRLSDVDNGVRIYGEKDTGLEDVSGYIINYQKLVNTKFLIAGGSDLDVVLAEVGYEK